MTKLKEEEDFSSPMTYQDGKILQKELDISSFFSFFFFFFVKKIAKL